MAVKIAIITFAFDNAKVIKWLRRRGEFIQNEEWRKLNHFHEHIHDHLKNDKGLLDKL